MPNKKDFRNRHVKQILRQTILLLLAKQDFDQITVNEICMEAAMSRTTFYQHYQDKFDLMVDSLADLTQPTPGQLEQDDLEGYFDKVLTACFENLKVMQRLQQYDGTRELQYRIDACLVDKFIHYFKYHEKLGGPFEIPAEILAEYVCSGVNSVIKLWYKNKCQPPKNEMAEFLSRNVRMAVENNRARNDSR